MPSARGASVLCLALLAGCVLASPIAAQNADPDSVELRNFVLTEKGFDQFAAAARAFAATLKNDPRYGRLLTLKKEQDWLGKKAELTPAEKKRLEQLATEIKTLENEVAGAGLDLSDLKTLSDMEAAVRKQPALAAAIQKQGMSPRDFVKFALALFQAMMIHEMQKSGYIKDIPKEMASSVNAANIKFVATHEAKIQQIMKELQALGGQQ
jgi:hypothetical protein